MSRYFRKDSFLTYLKLSLFQTVLFCSVYGTTNWIASRHQYHFHFWHPAELGIPFIPAMILIYLSIDLLMILPAFTLSVEELKKLNKSMTWATLIAGLFFIFLPAPIGYTPQNISGEWQSFYHALYTLDRPTNTFPSLHITYSWLFCRILIHCLKRFKLFLVLWFFLISFSVLLTHQHHILDIFGGIILAEFCYRKYFND